ncbi:hypothetical protein GUITHDRAFT_153806, partial [Guillardia theta CCMP2712]
MASQAAKDQHGNLDNAGTHSLRKGGITHLLGMMDGPGAPTVYIRANWKIGETQDRYILGETGGDQFAGRILAGNDSGTADFAVLPPHFTTEGLKQIEEIGWERFISGYRSFPAGFQKCIRFFLASVLWHLPTLQEWFPHSNDDIWGIPMFGMFGQGSMARLMSLREHIIVCSHRCTHCGMSASGTPTKTEILKGMKDMRVEVRDAIKEEMKVIEEKMDVKMKAIE